MDWKDYKNLGSWPFRFQQDRPHYNEGNRISNAGQPVWTTDFTGKPITPTHAPWCGYWHDHPAGDYVKGLMFPSNPFYPDPYEICVEDPNIAWDYDNSATVASPNTSVAVAITGLNTPFVWEVTGTGFSLSRRTTIGLTNTLEIADIGCGSATITVTGCDDRETVGHVRCTIGVWGPDIEGCRLGGPWDTVSGWVYTKTQGNVRQLQRISPTTNASAHCGEGPCGDTCAIFGNFLINCLSISCADHGWSEPACTTFCCGDPCNSGICWPVYGEPCQETADCVTGASCGLSARCLCTDYVRYNIWGCP